MKKLTVPTLILLGLYWVFFATIIPKVMGTRATSDAASFQASLHNWMLGKIEEGNLNESDLKDLFPDGYSSLRVGGEKKNENHFQMIERISQSSAPPVWPGFISILVGLTAAFNLKTDPAKENEH